MCKKCEDNVDAATGSPEVQAALAFFDGTKKCVGHPKEAASPPSVSCAPESEFPIEADAITGCSESGSSSITVGCAFGAGAGGSGGGGPSPLIGLLLHEIQHARQNCEDGCRSTAADEKNKSQCRRREAEAQAVQCKYLHPNSGSDALKCCEDYVLKRCGDENHARSTVRQLCQKNLEGK